MCCYYFALYNVTEITEQTIKFHEQLTKDKETKHFFFLNVCLCDLLVQRRIHFVPRYQPISLIHRQALEVKFYRPI